MVNQKLARTKDIIGNIPMPNKGVYTRTKVTYFPAEKYKTICLISYPSKSHAL